MPLVQSDPGQKFAASLSPAPAALDDRIVSAPSKAITPDPLAKKRKWPLFLIFGLLLIVVLAVIWRYSDLLGARISNNTVQITLARGASHTLLVPNETVPKKVELCRGWPKPACQVLTMEAIGQYVTFKIPADAPLGPVILQVTEPIAGGISSRIVLSEQVTLVSGANTGPGQVAPR